LAETKQPPSRQAGTERYKPLKEQQAMTEQDKKIAAIKAAIAAATRFGQPTTTTFSTKPPYISRTAKLT
jgi:hypothetical protein